jgi:hypothetical protein
MQSTKDLLYKLIFYVLIFNWTETSGPSFTHLSKIIDSFALTSGKMTEINSGLTLSFFFVSLKNVNFECDKKHIKSVELKLNDKKI